jgi:hypothetical protein
VAKAGIVIEEADECQFWLELLIELRLAPAVGVEELVREAGEFMAILIAARRTAKRGAVKK